MSNIMPPNRPKASRKVILELIPASVTDKVVLVGVRGYYAKSMGPSNKNDRGIYDDAIFLVAPEDFRAFNANTDPSIWRKGIATLKAGIHRYKQGMHKGRYKALRPATPNEELPVTRDGIDAPWPGVAINIHKGSLNSTSSEGCQTIHPYQYPEFQHAVYYYMNKYQQTSIPYVLHEGAIN